MFVRKRKSFTTIITLLLTIGALFTASVAYADNGTGGEGKGNGSSVTFNHGAYPEWLLVAKPWYSNPYDQLGRNSNGIRPIYYLKNPDTLRKQIDSLQNVKTSNGEPLSSICQRSDYIWYVNAGGTEIMTWQGHGTKSYKDWWLYWHGMNPPTARSEYGDAANSVLAAMYESGALNSKNKYTIICSGDYTPYWNHDFTIHGSDAASVSGVYSYTVVADGKYIPHGSWEPVKPAIKKTAFGEAFDKLINNNPNNEQEYSNLVGNIPSLAEQSRVPGSSLTVNLGDNNEKVLAQGGVVDYSLYSREAKISGTAQYTWNVSMEKCTQPQQSFSLAYNNQKDYYTSVQDAQNLISQLQSYCGNGSVTVSNPQKTFNVNPSMTTQRQIGFWETIVAHCNKEGFEALKGKIGDNISHVNNISDNNTGVFVTKKFTDKSEARSKMGGLLGEPGLLGETRDKGFYDKECPFVCEVDKIETFHPEDNDGNPPSHVSETGPDMVMFRDNESRLFTIDRWVPSSVNGVSFDRNNKALTTTIVLGKESTPSVTGKDTQGRDSGSLKISGYDSSGKKVDIFGFNTNIPDSTKIQRNWDTSSFSGLYNSVVKGEITTFDVRANWASENNKPVKLNVKWEYDPHISTPITSKNVGFDNNGNMFAGNPVMKNIPVQGKCYAAFNRANETIQPFDTVKAFHDNTGSDSTNNLDNNIIDRAYQLTITFVRSTTS